MKRTDLEKNKGLKINGQMKNKAVPARFGQDAGSVLDKREQRKLDQALGLMPFAVKLNSELVGQLQALATERQISMNDLVAELIKKGLAS
ncbi:hypothetical protein QU481_10600 [Crenobacter sp. SG2303]|uniref:LexA regulated protein n=1 Tax=Crenobacter oryzisoli TaxID=3056844 RepID=A0ABT7XP50_9NEIS|nr:MULTISPECIES: hypothetical protein [unclassified Crenobacter]MDN0075339.1 hypothetical protein [Crenobacter sp. SG2303]MDN0083180.1 hypothetical protein [Crenobacter sp. SG2305]